MITTTRFYYKKVCTLILIVLLVYGPVGHGQTANRATLNAANFFKEALKACQSGSFEIAAAMLTKITDSQVELEPKIRAKIYLLLGVCREKTGEIEEAIYYFKQLKKRIE